MALFQVGIDVSRYQGSINWSAVAAAGKQFAIVRIGSSNNNGAYVDPYFLQNVNGAHAAGLRVGAYYYTYARTESAVAGELTTFLNALEGLQLEYPVFVDVEASSLTSLGKPQLTNLVKYAMDILNQRKWYAGWYSYTNYINSYMNASALANYPLWVADYRSSLGYTGQYGMWQYSGSGTVSGITGAVDLDYSYQDYLPTIRAGNLNDVVGYLPLGSYPVTQITKEKYNGYDWVVFEYNGGQYWTALIGDRNRLERDDTTDDCSRQLAEANAKIAAAKAALE